MGVFFSCRPQVINIHSSIDNLNEPSLDISLFNSVEVESLYGSWANINVEDPLRQFAPDGGGTQDTCLNNTSGEEKKKEHEIVVYPNIRASPTKQLTRSGAFSNPNSLRASPTKQLTRGGTHLNRSNEESTAAGAGTFNSKKDDEPVNREYDKRECSANRRDCETTYESASHLKESPMSTAYLNAETLQLLDEPAESIHKRKQHAGSVIADAIQRQMEILKEQIDPEEVARQLFGVGIIGSSDMENATNKARDKEDRASKLLLLLVRKLRGNPHWFEEACVALDKAGVTAVQEVRALVMRRCPEDVLSIGTSTYQTCPSELGGSINSGFFSLGSAISSKRLHTITHDYEPQPSPLPPPPPPSKFELAVESSGEEELSVTVTRLESIYKLEGLARARNLLVRQSSTEQNNLLHAACRAEVDPAMLNLLITECPSCRSDLNSADKHGRTPLHVACAAIQPCMNDVQASLNPGSVLHIKEQLMKIESLLSSGANSNLQDEDGNTPLHLATLRRNADAVKLLLKFSTSSINVQNKLGNTALHIACRDGLVEIVQLLCAHKADTALQNNQKGRTPLHLACVGEHVEAAKCVAVYDPSSLHGIDKSHRTALHIACKRHVPSLAEELVRCKSCVPYKVDQDLKTPLHYACYWGNPDLVTPLLDRNHGKAFVDAQDRNGDTALHIACRHGHRKVIKELQRRKANQHIQNHAGKTPAELAIEEENDLAAKMLLKKDNVLSWREKLKTLQENTNPSPASFRSSMSSIISQMSVVLISSDEETDDETFLQTEDPDDVDF